MASGTTGPGRHRTGRQVRARWKVAAAWCLFATLCVVAAGSAAAIVLGASPGFSSSSQGRQACDTEERTLNVAAAPEIAPVLAAATQGPSAPILSDSCLHIVVSPRDPSEMAGILREGRSSGADLWVPDSSIWLRGLEAANRLNGEPGISIARSPIVLAIAANTAKGLGWPQKYPDIGQLMAPGTSMTRLALPDPSRSAAGSMGLLAVSGSYTSNSAGRTALSTTLRSALLPMPQDASARLEQLGGKASLAIPVPEQAVWAANAAGTVRAVSLYPAGGQVFDYPLLVLTHDAAAKAAAGTLRDALTGAGWAARVQAAGFRAAKDGSGPAATAQRGINPALGTASQVPSLSAVQSAVRTFELVTKGTRMLAVIDVSASMTQQVPGANGATRMDLVKDAALHGLALYPDDAQIGLWVFASSRNRGNDFRELTSIGTLATRLDGVAGREKLAKALSTVHYVPNGGTALYDTTLAAVQSVRRGWDPSRVNSVVVLTDGRDENSAISLDQLLVQLRRETGNRPVPVIGIAYGRDSDISVLRQISDATGGTAYEVDNPRRIQQVLADALARRPCRPQC